MDICKTQSKCYFEGILGTNIGYVNKFLNLTHIKSYKNFHVMAGNW